MNHLELKIKYSRLLQDAQSQLNGLQVQLSTAKAKMQDLLDEQSLIERSKVSLEQARPLLSASSIKQLEALANSALSTIFEMDGSIEYDVESKRFVLVQPDGYKTDLADANGGGVIAAVSAVFDLFLLVKKGCRRLLIYDEAFYAISDQYYSDFIAFYRQACKDLGVDSLWVSHDARLTPDMVDHVYRIENGQAIRIK